MAKYYVSFDTKQMAGKILATKVTLSHELVRDMEKQLPVNLCDDPLYEQLEFYVLNNPSRRKRDGITVGR